MSSRKYRIKKAFMKPVLITRITVDKEGKTLKVNLGTRGTIDFKEKSSTSNVERTIKVPAITDNQIKFLIDNKLPCYNLFEENEVIEQPLVVDKK
jgi:hypothetical protein